ncbi:MAG TPA: hypothetical protein VMS40_10420 [Vicinamibacterales bacterium]|jgi:hypothetical protein|nr:hypothetical protein [Vicinamibacterales bacterium]
MFRQTAFSRVVNAIENLSVLTAPVRDVRRLKLAEQFGIHSASSPDDPHIKPLHAAD